MEKNVNDSGVESVEHGFTEEPVSDPIGEIEAESFSVSAPELEHDMKKAGIHVPEKPVSETATSPSGVDQVELGFEDRPGEDVLAAAATSGVVSSAELAGNLKAAGIEVPGKPAKESAASAVSGVDQVELGFEDHPGEDVLAAAATSGVVSSAELAGNLRAAGIEVPEKPAKESAASAVSGVDQVELGFEDHPAEDVLAAAATSGVVSPTELAGNLRAAGIEVPEKTPKEKAAPPASDGEQNQAGPEDQIAEDVLATAYSSGVVSPTELNWNLKAAGIDVPESAPKEKDTPGPSGVEQVETGYQAGSPLDVLTAASMSAVTSPKERTDALKAAGITCPEPPVKEEEEGLSGIESVQSGFTAEPEMNSVEELNATRYAAAPQEIEENIEKVEKEYLGERVQVNDALLSKLKESGYNGDLEDLRKLFDDLRND